MSNRTIWISSYCLDQKFKYLFLMLKKWIMFNSTFCVQLKVNYWLSEEVGGSPRLGRLPLKMFRMQTCSSTHASTLQVQYIGFSCFLLNNPQPRNMLPCSLSMQVMRDFSGLSHFNFNLCKFFLQ